MLTDDQRRTLETLARIRCNYEEIAASIGVSSDWLSQNYSEQIAKWREAGKASLRHKQWQRAMAGSDRMLIHLGKHELDQVDTQRTELSGPGGAPMEHTHTIRQSWKVGTREIQWN